jgi:hypothetical protein
MDNSNQQNQQTPNPQYQQTIIIVGKQKSVGVAFILAFFFGPLGLLYASVTGGIVMIILGVIISIVTLGFGLIVVWIVCIIWAIVAANSANSKITAAAGANINLRAASPQPQTINPTPPQQVTEQLAPQQAIVQQPASNLEAQPQYITPKQQETNVQKTNDPSLNALTDWVTNNKKGLMFGLGGIVIVLVLIVAIKYVVSVNFSKSKPDTTLSRNSNNPDNTDLGGDANAPILVPNSSTTDNTSTTYSGLFPQSSTRLLTQNDLSTLNKRDLKIMRNEIFARHGYIFKTADMKNYFAQQSWYRPLYGDVNNLLTSIEKTNVELIKSYEK